MLIKGVIIVLFPMLATSGRMFRTTRTVERVGIVQKVEEGKVTVQEIDYPSRRGETIYIETAEGLKRSYGTWEIPSDSEQLIPLVDEVIAKDGSTISRGSRLNIRRGRTRTSGYVLYVFKNKTASYAAVTDEKGWECYSTFGEDCFTRQYIRLSVRTLVSNAIP